MHTTWGARPCETPDTTETARRKTCANALLSVARHPRARRTRCGGALRETTTAPRAMGC